MLQKIYDALMKKWEQYDEDYTPFITVCSTGVGVTRLLVDAKLTGKTLELTLDSDEDAHVRLTNPDQVVDHLDDIGVLYIGLNDGYIEIRFDR